MHNNINNTNKDGFSEALRNKLEHHSTPVDAGSWNVIRAGMKAQKRKKLIPFWWTTAGAAAVVLFVVSLQLFNNSAITETQLAVNKSIEKEIQMLETNKKSVETARIEDIKPTNVTSDIKKIAKTSKSKTPLAKNDIAVIYTNNDTIISNIVELNHAADSVKSVDNKLAIANKNKISENKIAESNKKKLKINDIESKGNWEDPLKNSESNDWAVLASVGSSSGIETANRFLSASPSSGQFASIVKSPRQRTNTTILAPNDFAAKTYHAPLSVGFTALKKISNSISIETGLVYTYLLTDFEASNYSAKLNLHYLGVPLNINVQLWRNNKWSVYASAGAMIEKGLQSVYIQDQHFGNQIINTTAHTNIDGFQWSINAASGITYNIFKEFDLYFEPKLSYSFDNDQPISIKTDKKYAIGIEAGARFRF